ncbi:MAG: hypothetical protein AVDCRST_MAG33-3451, partial [uncultured Thermomicrobiales bacterium]
CRSSAMAGSGSRTPRRAAGPGESAADCLTKPPCSAVWRDSKPVVAL